MTNNPGKILKSLTKWILYSLGFFLALFFILLLLLRTEFAQDLIRKKASTYLSEKIGSVVSIGRFRTNLVSHFELQSVTIKDQSDDELLHIGNIEAEFNLFALLSNTLSVKRITIDTLNFRMARAENDSVFNFDFIIRAFTGPPSPEAIEDTTGNPMIFDIGKLSINQLHYIMDDKYGQQFYDVKSGLIALNVDKLDLENQIYKIKSFNTEGIIAELEIGTSDSDTTVEESTGQLPQVIIDNISLLNNSFSIQMPGAGYKSETSIHNFSAENLNLNLNLNKVDLKQLLIDQHQSQILIKSSQPELSPKAKGGEYDIPQSKPFAVTIGRIRLQDNDLKYDQEKATGKPGPGFDPEHIHLEQLQLLLENFAFEGSTVQGIVQQFHAKEQCGLDIQELSTGFVYADTGVVLNKFLFITPASIIDGDLKINYKSLADISKNPGQSGFDIDLRNMLLASVDMKHFRTMVSNNPDIQKLLSNNIYLEGKIKGKVADMNIENLKMETSGIRISASGKIAGLPDPNQLFAAINLKEFSGSTKSLSGLLPAGSIPPTIAANEKFNLKGKIVDNKGSHTFDLFMRSSAGNLLLKGNVKQLPGADKLTYNLHAQSEGLQLDRIMMDTLYGNTVFDIRANGKGISPKTAEAQVTVLIPAVYFKGYNYKNLDLNAAISASIVDANFKI